MTILVVLLGMMAGLAWFLPDERKRESIDDSLGEPE